MMRYIFPTKALVQFSQKYPKVLYGVFFLCMGLSIYRGYVTSSISSYDGFLTFFDGFNEYWRVFFASLLTALNTPIGTIGWVLLIFITFIYFMYFFSGQRGRVNFRKFIFSFLSFCFIGFLFGILNLIIQIQLAFYAKVLISIYCFSFYCRILIEEFAVRPLRSIGITFLSLLIVFPFGGFLSLAPYFQWL